MQNDGPLLVARAIPAKPKVVYSLIIPDYAKAWFYLNSTSGELWLRNKLLGDEIYFTIRAENPEDGETAEMFVHVMPEAASWKDCLELLSEDMCFWKDVQYQVYENREQTLLGEFGPTFNCQFEKPDYHLINGSEFLVVRGAKLYSRSALDRESRRPGPLICVAVRCCWDSQCVVNTIDVRVLDEDDNAPAVLQSAKKPLALFLSASQLQEDEVIASVTLIDSDGLKTNHYNWSILQDPLNLLRSDCIIGESRNMRQLGTSLKCKLRAAKTVAFERDSYLVVLRVNNTSMVPGLGHSHVDIYYNLTRSTGKKAVLTPYTAETAATYPKHVEIFRGAALYARVAQPSWTTTVDVNPETALNEPRYRLASPSPQISPFAITEQGGIIYLENTTRLQQGPLTMILKVEVGFPEDRVKNVTLGVSVVDGDADGPCNSTSHWFNMSEKHWDHCAESLSFKSCVSMCAVGTGSSSSQSVFRRLGNGCLWRGARKPSNSYTTNYSTCTPDIATCPDFNCDPLENLYNLICPQDCATKVYFAVGKEIRGLHGGRGICSCDEYAKCSCLSTNISVVSTTTTAIVPVFQHPEIGIRSEKESRTPCGIECMIGITLIPVLFLVTIFAAFICCRHRRNKTLMAKHCLGRVFSLPDIPMGYVEGDPEVEEAGNLEQRNISAAIASASTVNTLTKRTGPLDEKWEFPRRNLFFLDGKIGEGEFGVVLKAQALDLKGFPGLITVAVKTVKQHSSPQELQDLISEFELLKEVSHPNIIRLLGACSLPTNEPMLLIIEFAEYGSLRCYLRKVRNLGSEEPLPGPSTSTQPMVSNQDVTPRDILTFAWQISRGMAYLSEIKLVHRDLAARNVLLATGRVCKISDFGLTRDVYIDDAYQKKSNGRVPVKWMALECLADHIYTTKSDVWSFGILLWELVTLGATPYPGVEVHNLYNLLRGGHRMEKPFSCSDELYIIMSQCWKADPNERPFFKDIEVCLDQMLADGVDYLDIRQMMFDNKLYFDDEDEHMDDVKEDVAQYSSEDHTSASTAPLLETNIGKNDAHHINVLPEDEQNLLSDQPSTGSSSSGEDSQSCKTETNLNLEEDEDGYLASNPPASVRYMTMNGNKNKMQNFITGQLDSSKKFESQKSMNKAINADNIIHDK